METKLCRICGKLGQNYSNIFRTEGLKNKIETCLPIIVCRHSLLPDTICGECLENVDNFYNFIKNCLQNIIILEAQFDIVESCLKTKRKHDKSCLTDVSTKKQEKNTQTDNYLDLILEESEQFIFNLPPLPTVFKNNKLVDYDIESNSNSESEDAPNQSLIDNLILNRSTFGKKYFDDAENYLVEEITQRKNLKRKCDDVIQYSKPKIFKINDLYNRRKNRQPRKFEIAHSLEQTSCNIVNNVEEDVAPTLVETGVATLHPQLCLLCDEQFSGPSMLASHVFETHGIDMAQIVENSADKKKKLPSLLKISDLRKSDSLDDNQQSNDLQLSEEPPTLLPSFVCSLCPAMLTARPDLFTHLRVKHPEQASLICGMCLYQASSIANLESHIETCSQQHPVLTKYICQICRYGEDSLRSLENHVLVHDFLIEACKKRIKIYDPADYIELNHNYESLGHSPTKYPSCSDCGMDGFSSFKDFSTHRRSKHSIFHCDLCNKFYGRNSHLWKHVNRLHKSHPSITCQICYKTSASKYHLAQHFNKIHSSKPCKQKTVDLLPSVEEDFMSQKFQGFDFQSVKQSFMRQELLQQNKKISPPAEADDNSNQLSEPDDMRIKSQPAYAPKEIDTTSDLYTNIITNYTPPVNEGEFKCPKCGKGFHKKTLLKKHKKNCRPRLQKDLLTRCKSCARIFKDRQSLAKHLINYHSEYACEICGQKVQSKCEIVSHIRFSHPGCHLFCNICNNILRSRQDMAEHKSDHANSYVCQFCADSLPSKIKLKMHILSLHRKILSLSCGVCLKLFESQHILRDHVQLVHRDQLSPLTSCTVCGKNYGSKWKTYDHLNKSHGRIFKACKACLDVFDTDDQLQVHYNSVHVNSGVVKNLVPPSTTVAPSFTNNTSANNCDSESSESSDSEESDNEVEKDDEEEVRVVEYHPPPPPPSILDVRDSKISLLEKRLLGKKITEEDKKTVNASKPKKENNKKKDDLDQLDVVANNSPSQTNSSKRTVYVNSNDPSFCEICLKTWPAKKHLWQHYIRCHKSVAATVCGICLKTNDSYSSLQIHLKQTHPTLLHGQGFGSNFICRICGRYHNASSKLKLHMAIHENFDWSLLEQPQEEEKAKEKNGPETNGGEEINFDSLIEQVECSSASESEADNTQENKDDESSSSSEEEDSEEDDDDDDDDDDGDDDDQEDDDENENESEESANTLQSQMLQNMIREKQITENNGTKDYASSVTSESSTCFSVKSEACSVKSEDCLDEDDEVVGEESNTGSSLFQCKDEELNNAVQSITYEYVRKVDEVIDEDYSDLQDHSVNDNEIESAVGSIL